MDRAEQVRKVLATRGLTLYRVSQQSAEIYGCPSPFFVPHSLYSDANQHSLIPTLAQMIALSRITNYLLYDGLAVFGVDLDQIPRLQSTVPRKRTALLDSSVYDTSAWVPWFSGRPQVDAVPAIAPLGQLLCAAAPRRARELVPADKGRFLYGKVGEEDVHAFPHLAVGSIFRVDTKRPEEHLCDARESPGRRLFLVEHVSGYTCSRLVLRAKDRIVLHSPQNSCVETELRLGKEARIIGVVDAEIRPVWERSLPRPPQRSAIWQRPRLPFPPSPQPSLSALLRNSRLRLGVSFREASSTSRWIASTLSDELYFAAPGTLSDYETLSSPPRHIQKIITLCVLYCIDFRGFLRACGLPFDQERREPIPDELVPRRAPNRSPGPHNPGGQEVRQETGGFLDSLLNNWEEVPLFLRGSLKELAGPRAFSLLDVFWVGGAKPALHPLLVNAALVVVNRRMKRPDPSTAKTIRGPSLYLLLTRASNYICGCCTLEEGKLVVRDYAGASHGTQRFRNGIEAEVIGRVTTILRRLL